MAQQMAQDEPNTAHLFGTNVQKESQEDRWKSRVHCCGNIVVPAQAAAALQVVGRMPTFA